MSTQETLGPVAAARAALEADSPSIDAVFDALYALVDHALYLDSLIDEVEGIIAAMDPVDGSLAGRIEDTLHGRPR